MRAAVGLVALLALAGCTAGPARPPAPPPASHASPVVDRPGPGALSAVCDRTVAAAREGIGGLGIVQTPYERRQPSDPALGVDRVACASHVRLCDRTPAPPA